MKLLLTIIIYKGVSNPWLESQKRVKLNGQTSQNMTCQNALELLRSHKTFSELHVVQDETVPPSHLE